MSEAISPVAGFDPALIVSTAGGNWRVAELGFAWIGALLDARLGDAGAAAPDDRRVANARGAYDDARDRLRISGGVVAIDRLSAAFGLSPFEEDVCLLALAARVDEGLVRRFGQAAGRAASCPPLHLAVELLAVRFGEPAASAHLAFGPTEPLRRFGLIDADADAGLDVMSPLVLDESVARYLMGDEAVDPRAAASLMRVSGAPLAASQSALAEGLARWMRSRHAVFCGPAGSGRRAIAVEAAGRLGLAVFELRPPRLDGAALSLALTRVSRAAQLHGFAVLVDAARIRRLAGGDNRDAAEDALAAVMAGLDCSAVALEEEPRDASPGRRPILVEPPGDAERLEIWRAVAPEGAALDESALAELAAQFPLGPAEIVEVASASPAFRPTELWTAARERCRASTEGLGDIVTPRYGWDDIVLPADALDDLRAIAAQARHRSLVYNQWGFGARLVRNSGVTALFAGPSGVGKTMAAEVICQDLGVDLLRIDLSGVISKYIGETEKNLKRVFDGAQRSGAALFFDEADALFGKRSEVKDSHDRYANIEVSYLLQRMEAFSGLAILATNMKAHLDQAFLRRLRYVVDLPFPTGDLRREIWRRAFPAAAPTEALDLDMLARLEIAGGNIVVIAVNAAFHAASEGRPIAMAHVLRAARSEFRKLDRELRLPLGMEARHGR